MLRFPVDLVLRTSVFTWFEAIELYSRGPTDRKYQNLDLILNFADLQQAAKE